MIWWRKIDFSEGTQVLDFRREAVEKKYIDYKAHWLLAEGLARTEERDEAVKEITIAHILYRNDHYVKTSLEKITK